MCKGGSLLRAMAKVSFCLPLASIIKITAMKIVREATIGQVRSATSPPIMHGSSAFTTLKCFPRDYTMKAVCTGHLFGLSVLQNRIDNRFWNEFSRYVGVMLVNVSAKKLLKSLMRLRPNRSLGFMPEWYLFRADWPHRWRRRSGLRRDRDVDKMPKEMPLWLEKEILSEN